MSPTYVVESKDEAGHWTTLGDYDQLGNAMIAAQGHADEGRKSRVRRVSRKLVGVYDSMVK